MKLNGLDLNRPTNTYIQTYIHIQHAIDKGFVDGHGNGRDFHGHVGQ